jgi:hypothetical protein
LGCERREGRILMIFAVFEGITRKEKEKEDDLKMKKRR